MASREIIFCELQQCTWVCIVCVLFVGACMWAYCGHMVNIAYWCPLKSMHTSMSVYVCGCSGIHPQLISSLGCVCVCVCVWFDQRALTHGCPSGNQICHVAEHGHQVAMLSGSALPRRSPGRYPRNTLERQRGVGQQMEGRQQHTNDKTLITRLRRWGRCTTCY